MGYVANDKLLDDDDANIALAALMQYKQRIQTYSGEAQEVKELRDLKDYLENNSAYFQRKKATRYVDYNVRSKKSSSAEKKKLFKRKGKARSQSENPMKLINNSSQPSVEEDTVNTKDMVGSISNIDHSLIQNQTSSLMSNTKVEN